MSLIFFKFTWNKILKMSDFFSGKGFEINGLRHLSPKEAFEAATEGAVLLDVRETYLCNFKKYDLPGVLYIPFSNIENSYMGLLSDKPLIVADVSGLGSKEVAAFLQGKGFKNIANMAGGILEWERDGLPVIKGSKKLKVNGRFPS